jgi:very-short-patch-repair endonuclease
LAICDFVCREKQLIIEVDGGQHNESAADVIRDRRLSDEGYKVIRFWNNDVLGNIEGVLLTIQSALRG